MTRIPLNSNDFIPAVMTCECEVKCEVLSDADATVLLVMICKCEVKCGEVLLESKIF